MYHPLFRIHILGRKPTGALARPFTAASPMPFAPPPATKLDGAPDASPMGGLASLFSGGLGGGLEGMGSLAPPVASGKGDAAGKDTEGGAKPAAAAAEDTE